MHETVEIQTNFIDKFINCASHAYIIVYIMLLRRGGGKTDPAEIADFLNMTEGDIKCAISYWVIKGAISAEEPDDGGVLDIKILDFSNTSQEEDGENEEDEVTDEAKEGEAAATAKRLVMERRPVYSPKEMDFYLQNSKELSTLFKQCEGYLGKLLSYNDMSALFSFHDWLRMPIDVIDLLVSYCSSNDRRSMRYIEKVAIAWSDAGINTKEKATAQIKLYNGDFRAIMKELGKAHRDPIKTEEDYMIKWLKTYNLPLEIVLAACTKTTMQASRPSFKYANEILEKWFTAGITTMSEVEKSDNDFEQAKHAKSKALKETVTGAKAEPRRKTRSKFANFKERDDIDFEELRKLEMERIDRELGIK